MSIYTALSGAIAAEEKVNTISNNIANVNTKGFKKDQLTFKEYLTTLEKKDENLASLLRDKYTWDDYHNYKIKDKSFVKIDSKDTDFSQGVIEHTHNPLDLAIDGEGFFAVKTPFGHAFTRNGSFTINKDGYITTSEGYELLVNDNNSEDINEYKPIKLETNAKVIIDEKGNIYQNSQKIGKINVISFEDLKGLKKVGSNLFQNQDFNLNQIKTTKSKIIQGALEGSNVNPVTEIVDLINANRAFETYNNIIKSFDEVDTKAIREVGRING